MTDLEKKAAYQREWCRRNPEKKKALDRASYLKNRDERLAKGREWTEKNPEKSAEIKRAYYLRNREKVIQRSAEWRKNNTEKRNGMLRVWSKKKRIEDVNFKILANLRGRIWWALQRKVVKSAKTLRLIGCHVDQLRAHLEKQFTTGMSWQNYGLWHIDHIRPCSSFDLTKPEQQRLCFNFSNLQPLWAVDNLKKGSK